MLAFVLTCSLAAAAPLAWDCDESLYDDGVCDCGCGFGDADCEGSGEFDVCERSSCSEGQVPWEHSNESCMASTCGDGWKADDEACDDGNALASGGCNATCSAVNEDFNCGELASGCTPSPAEGEGEGDDEQEPEGRHRGAFDCASTSAPASALACLMLALVRRRNR